MMAISYVDTEIIRLCDFLMHSCQGLITKEKPFVYYGYTELWQKSSSSITQTPGPVPGTDIELVMSHWVLTNHKARTQNSDQSQASKTSNAIYYWKYQLKGGNFWKKNASKKVVTKWGLRALPEILLPWLGQSYFTTNIAIIYP